MRSAKDLLHELDYWFHIGIADDIFRVPEQRPEYGHLVRKLRARDITDNNIPVYALTELKKEIKLPLLFQPTFWHLLKLDLAQSYRRWRHKICRS